MRKSCHPTGFQALSKFALIALTVLPLVRVEAGRVFDEKEKRAQELASTADSLALKGAQSEAVERYRSIVRLYPLSLPAPRCQLRIADLLSANAEYENAFEAYQTLLDKFPESDLFTRAIEGQYAIVRRVMDSHRHCERRSVKPPPTLPDLEALTAMLRKLLGTGGYTSFSPSLQYRLAVALDHNGQDREAVAEFSQFLAAYSDDPQAADAAFQIGFIEYRKAREGNWERGARDRSKLAFDYFLNAFPESEKAPEAAHLRAVLDGWNAAALQESGHLYEKTGKPEAALKEYNEALESAKDDAAARKLAERIQSLKKKLR